MYITFTYRCRDCGHEEDRFVKRAEVDEQVCKQMLPRGVTDYPCGGQMDKLPAGTRTHFRFADTKLKD